MTSAPSRAAPAVDARRDELALAIERTASARAIAGNTLSHHPDSPAAIEAIIALIAGAAEWIHFENYIIRADRTGRRVADALAERARAGVRVRILYDALGSFGTGYRFWRALRHAGVEVTSHEGQAIVAEVGRYAQQMQPLLEDLRLALVDLER